MDTIPQTSVDTQMIYDRLAKAAIGDVVTYGELSRLIGGDVQNGKRHCLATARSMALRANRMVFEPVHNVGVKRLADSEIVQTGTTTMLKIRRAAKRGAAKLASVQDFDALAPEQRIRHNALLSSLGAVSMFAKETSLRKIESRVDKAQAKLPIGDTLKMFTP